MIRPQLQYLLLPILAAALTMLPVGAGWAANETPASNTPANGPAEVTITAQHLEVEKQVSRFVSRIAAAENGAEGLARWEAPPACPLVSGLPQQDGEFILDRLSEIAIGAGIPLADENCRPNLYILVTDQPEGLLRGMEKRNRAFTFGYNFALRAETPASVVDEFIKTPRPVRVWYNSAEKDAWGLALAYCPAADLAAIECQAASAYTTGPPGPMGTPRSLQSACSTPHFDPGQVYQCGRAATGGTRVSFNNMWWLSRVFVIVDQKRLHGVTLRQLADYVAMAGLAKLKPDIHLGDTPTILTLFDAGPQAAPMNLTPWDKAFLKSLYATEQKSKVQRSQIARQMVREIAP
jgi:hypothetical protein